MTAVPTHLRTGDAEAAGDTPTTDPLPSVAAPRRTPMSRLAPSGMNPWVGRAVFVAFAVALFVLPELLGDPTRTRQWAEYLCYAMIAVGIDVAWGYGGMLVLGQGMFFGLGAYAMGMHLSLEQVPDGQLPSFMTLYSDYTELPLLWKPFQHLWFAAGAAVLLPMLVAAGLGYLVFKRRVRGPYFAILTQASTVVFWLLLVGQLQLTAGTNGLTNFSTIFGRNRYDPSTPQFVYSLAAGALVVIVGLGILLVRSRFGRLLVATRDAEDRVRFLGYDPALVKTVGFAIAAAMAGIAGALSAPIIGIVAPNQFAALPSILMVCWVAVGGRGTIWGAVLGALLVGWGRTTFSETWPEQWTYVQGLLFVVVVAFIPGGIAGLTRLVRGGVRRQRRSRADGETAEVLA
jgi:urea transport system permease protein